MERRPGKRSSSAARSFAAGAVPVLLLFAVIVPLLTAYLWMGGTKDLVVVAFDARSGEPALDEALRAELVSQLQGAKGVRIVTDIPLPVEGRETKPATRLARRELCGATGADYIFTGKMSRDRSHYLLGIQVRSCSQGQPVMAERQEVVSRDQLPQAIQWIASVARRLAS